VASTLPAAAVSLPVAPAGATASELTDAPAAVEPPTGAAAAGCIADAGTSTTLPRLCVSCNELETYANEKPRKNEALKSACPEGTVTAAGVACDTLAAPFSSDSRSPLAPSEPCTDTSRTASVLPFVPVSGICVTGDPV